LSEYRVVREIADAAEDYGIGEPCSAKWVDVLADDGDDAEIAVQAMMGSRCAALSEKVRMLLSHSHRNVRRNAIRALGTIGDGRATTELKLLATGSHGELSALALESWCELDAPRCKPLLSKMALDSSNGLLQDQAILAARVVGYEFTSGEIARILAPIGRASRSILYFMSCEHFNNEPLRKRVLDLIEGIVTSAYVGEEVETAWEALRALTRCKVSAAGGDLIDLLRTVQEYDLEDEGTWILVEAVVATAGKESVKVLEDFVLSHSSPPIFAQKHGISSIRARQEPALEALAEFGGVSSLPALKHALGDASYRVRMSALNAIEKLGLICHLQREIRSIAVSDSHDSVRQQAEELLKRVARECAAGRQGVSSSRGIISEPSGS